MQALKKASLVFLDILDCQMLCSLLQAFQAWALRVRKSFLLSATNEPRYLKSDTSLSCVPSLARIRAGLSSPLTHIYSVFLALRKRPTLAEVSSKDDRRSWASCNNVAVKAMSSAWRGCKSSNSVRKMPA